MSKLIYRILRMKQDDLHRFLMDKLRGYGYTEIRDNPKYLYAKGEIPVMVTAHLDTVFKRSPRTIHVNHELGTFTSPQGIGGDDRCGVFGILLLLKAGYRPDILFTHDEEKGLKGALEAVYDMHNPKVNFIIGLDRRGFNEAVFYDCGNKEFQEFILSFGFKHEIGTWSDVSELGPAWDTAIVNFSVGYYQEHSVNEVIFIDHLYYTISKVMDILDTPCDKHYPHETVSYGLLYDDWSDQEWDDWWRNYLLKRGKPITYYSTYENS